MRSNGFASLCVIFSLKLFCLRLFFFRQSFFTENANASHVFFDTNSPSYLLSCLCSYINAIVPILALIHNKSRAALPPTSVLDNPIEQITSGMLDDDLDAISKALARRKIFKLVLTEKNEIDATINSPHAQKHKRSELADASAPPCKWPFFN